MRSCAGSVKPTKWESSVVSKIMEAILVACKERGSCSVVLTGGRSAESLYKVWSALPSFAFLRNVQFYFGDERCVPPNDKESNYGMAMRTLFLRGVPQNCTVNRIAADQMDHEAAAATYAMQLPDRVDLVLLSLGLDGHIASIFPHSTALKETEKRVVSIRCHSHPHERVTITPQVIRSAHHVIVLALGSEKRIIYEQAKSNPADIDTLPARLLLDKTWIFGE